MNSSHYETLRVDRLASTEDVRDAYRRMAQKFHPDKCPGDEGVAGAAAAMARINEAYEVLSDGARRAAYDMALSGRQRCHVAAPRLVLDFLGRPWYLLAGTLLVTLFAVGLVALRFTAPGQPAYLLETPAAQLPPADPIPLVASRQIEPLTESPASVRPVLADTEPVMQLVREGTIRTPPMRQ